MNLTDMPRLSQTAAIDDRARAVQLDPRWRAVVDRDPGADGTFVFAVRTTTVYCRPSCGARRPRPENVEFLLSPAHARSRGYRACKRCRPDDAPAAKREAELVARCCRLLESADRSVGLRDLATETGMSTFHLQRRFKAVMGITPRVYAAAHRAERVRAELGKRRTVTAAIYAAGYESSARFYADAQPNLGMAPSRYLARGANEQIRFAVGRCSLGRALVAATARGICAILLGDDAEALVHDLHARFTRAQVVEGDAEFERTVAQVVEFVDATRAGLDLPLDIRGTVFQQRVWQVLRRIPPGKTWSYAQVARQLGAPRAARAVAMACAANALAVAIPCHRVVRADGDTAGYCWGVDRKRALLARERVPSQ